MIKKIISRLALILALSSCSNLEKVKKIDYLGAFKKNNSIYFKLGIENIGTKYLIDHGSNNYGRKNSEGYIFPRESHGGTNQLMIQFMPDEDGMFDETRFVKDGNIFQENQQNTRILTSKILKSGIANKMREDAQKLYNIRNSDTNALSNDEKILMNFNELKFWIQKQ